MRSLSNRENVTESRARGTYFVRLRPPPSHESWATTPERCPHNDRPAQTLKKPGIGRLRISIYLLIDFNKNVIFSLLRSLVIKSL